MLGIFPQCGFSVAATNFYATRVITLGTLISVYLSTSDEMLPILISEAVPINIILGILTVKFAFGMFYGFIIDFVLRKKNKGENKIVDLCEEEHCHCEKSLIKSALKHTISIVIYIFILTLIVNIIVHMIGEDILTGFMSNSKLLRTSSFSINWINSKLCFISNYNRIILRSDNKFWFINWRTTCKCWNTDYLYYLE